MPSAALHNRVDCPREVPPFVVLPIQRAMALPRELVDTPSPAICFRPPAGQKSGALQAMQRRIERALRQAQCIGAAFTQRDRNGVAMGRTRLNGGEEEQIEVALQDFGVHASACYTS